MSVPRMGERVIRSCAAMSASSAFASALRSPTSSPSCDAGDLEQLHDVVARRPRAGVPASSAAWVRALASIPVSSEASAGEQPLGLDRAQHLVEHEVPRVVGRVRGHERGRAGVGLAVVRHR